MALRFRVHLDRTVLSSQLYLDFLKNVCCKDAIWSCLFDRPPNLCFFVDRGVTMSRKVSIWSTCLQSRWWSITQKRDLPNLIIAYLINAFRSLPRIEGQQTAFVLSMNCCCSLQTKRSDFLLYSYIIESLIGWVFNQLNSLTERSTFFPRTCLVRWGGGVGGRGVKINKKFSGGVALANSVGGRGCWSEKNFQIWDLQTLAPLQQVVLQKICIPMQNWKPAASQLFMSILFPKRKMIQE